MEVITATLHIQVPVGDPSRIGEARRHAAQLAQDCGFDEVDAGRLALVVTELGTNLMRHAREGRLLLSARPQRREVEVLSVDRGPGIPDVRRSLDDGFSTGSTPGTGLGAVRRLSQVFEVHSQVPSGTVVLARVRAAGAVSDEASHALCAGAVSVAAPGERVCGDGWAIALDGDNAGILVVDGLGHGPDAAEAAQAAVDVFCDDPTAGPRRLLERTHARLRSTRGAALMALRADAAGTVRSCGAGNIIARLVSGTTDKTVLTQNGTVGLTIRTPEETTADWPPHALVVVCSDGIETRWKPELLRPVLQHDPVIAAAVILRDHCRGRDDATVAVLRRRG